MSALRGGVWWILVAYSALVLLFGITDVLVGATADAGIPTGLTGRTPVELEAESAAAYRMFDFTTRTQGLLLVVLGALLLAVLVVPYRRGERWAWYTAWVIPAWSIIGVPGLYLAFGLAPAQAPPPPLISGPILGIIAAAILVLDRRRFETAT